MYTGAIKLTTLQHNPKQNSQIAADAYDDSTRPVCTDASSCICICVCVCICPMIEPVVSALMLQSCPLCSAIKLSTLLCDQPVNTAIQYWILHCVAIKLQYDTHLFHWCAISGPETAKQCSALISAVSGSIIAV